MWQQRHSSSIHTRGPTRSAFRVSCLVFLVVSVVVDDDQLDTDEKFHFSYLRKMPQSYWPVGKCEELS